MAFSKGSLSLFYIYNVHLSSSRIFSTSTRPFPNTLKLFDTGERGKSFQICFSDILSSPLAVSLCPICLAGNFPSF